MLLKNLRKNEFWIIIFLGISILTIIFGKVLDNYVDREGLVLFDGPIYNWVQNIRNPELNKIFLLITLAGNWQMLVWGSILGCIILAAASKFRYLAAMIISNGVGILFTESVKRIIDRPRPPLAHALIAENGFAFPSGHSFFAVVFYGLIAYFCFKQFKNKIIRVIILFMSVTGGGALAFSRIYLGVHWASDVVAGLSSSGAWLLMTIAYLEARHKDFGFHLEKFNKRQIKEGVWAAAILWTMGILLLYGQTVTKFGI